MLRQLAKACVLPVALSLSGCAWVECAVLCEQFVSEGMHNPASDEKIVCGNHVQKGKITKAELDEISACVADYAAKGFVLDRSTTK